MIVEDERSRFTTLDRYELSNILSSNGYTGLSFNSVRFLGLTNSGNFCYNVKFFDDHSDGEQTGKVFVSKTATGKITAEF
jgi:hypothetical protein